MEHVKQTTDSNCGPTCVAILTGDSIPSKHLISIDKDEGTTPFQLAAYLAKYYTKNTTILSYFHPALVNSADQYKVSKEELYHRLLTLVKPSTCFQRMNLNYAMNYLKYTPDDTANLEVAIPTMAYIDKYLSKGFNAICLVTSSHFYDESYDPHDEPFNNHFVVISKHASEPATFYKLFDPLTPKSSSIRKDILIFSMNVTVLKDNCGTGATIFFR